MKNKPKIKFQKLEKIKNQKIPKCSLVALLVDVKYQDYKKILNQYKSVKGYKNE